MWYPFGMAGEKKITSKQLLDLLAPVSRWDRGKILAEALELEREEERMRSMYDKYAMGLKATPSGPATAPVPYTEWKKWYAEQGPWDIGRGTVLRDPERPPSKMLARGMYDVGIEPTAVQRAQLGMAQKSGADLITDEQIAALGARAPVPDDMWSDPDISDQRKLEEARQQSMADAIEVLIGRARVRAR